MEDYALKYRLAGNLNTTITGKYLYTLLCDLAGKKGRIQLSIRVLSETLNISRTAVSRNLHRLEESGYIRIRSVSDSDGTRKANEYIIC
ncbi:MAG: hypothetical protein CVV00_10075 [Firmicutes bacterium HGW-Firmicutes-5]|nr:MAG: hypothetical protein CVV00_10075 [Firmicutes bacterium HGW-Firmicutes-5]